MNIMEVVGLGTLGCAIAAILIAIRSLRETGKTRRDMFLPIVTSKEHSSRFLEKHVLFYFVNVGNGPAVQPTIWLKLSRKRCISGYFCESIQVEKEDPQDYLDHRQTQGYYHAAFDISDVDFQSPSNQKAVLEVHYSDIFGRRIRTIYDLLLQTNGQRNQFRLRGPKIALP